MKKYRVNTTISKKHHAILKKYTEKYGTQQSVLELALENDSNKSKGLSKEEQVWMRMYQIKDMLCVLPKDYTVTLFETADLDKIQDYVKNDIPVEFAIEWYYNKPLKECTLKEIIKGVVLNIKMQSTVDTINYTDGGDHYYINMTHGLGIKGAKSLVIMNESVFNSYGVEFESDYSKRSVFFKVYKPEKMG